jgi:hypothetical protein
MGRSVQGCPGQKRRQLKPKGQGCGSDGRGHPSTGEAMSSNSITSKKRKHKCMPKWKEVDDRTFFFQGDCLEPRGLGPLQLTPSLFFFFFFPVDWDLYSGLYHLVHASSPSYFLSWGKVLKITFSSALVLATAHPHMRGHCDLTT